VAFQQSTAASKKFAASVHLATPAVTLSRKINSLSPPCQQQQHLENQFSF
jgi:hypothetical protein